MENSHHQPYLNANLYRLHESDERKSSFDYIHIHKDGKTLVGSSDFTCRHWYGSVTISKSVDAIEDNSKESKCSVLTLLSGTNSGCFVENSEKIAICEDSGRVSIWQEPPPSSWDTTWILQANMFEHDDSVLDIEHISQSDNIVTVSADANIKIWNLDNRLLPVTTYRAAHEKMINSVNVKPEERSIFMTGSADGAASVWDLRTAERIAVRNEVTSGIRCAIWFNRQYGLIGTDAGELLLFDMRATAKPTVLENFDAAVHRIITRANGDVAVCCDNSIVNVYNLNDKTNLEKLYKDGNKHEAFIRGIAFDPFKENSLYTASWDGRIHSHAFRT